MWLMLPHVYKQFSIHQYIFKTLLLSPCNICNGIKMLYFRTNCYCSISDIDFILRCRRGLKTVFVDVAGFWISDGCDFAPCNTVWWELQHWCWITGIQKFSHSAGRSSQRCWLLSPATCVLLLPRLCLENSWLKTDRYHREERRHAKLSFFFKISDRQLKTWKADLKQPTAVCDHKEMTLTAVEKIGMWVTQTVWNNQ